MHSKDTAKRAELEPSQQEIHVKPPAVVHIQTLICSKISMMQGQSRGRSVGTPQAGLPKSHAGIRPELKSGGESYSQPPVSELQ